MEDAAGSPRRTPAAPAEACLLSILPAADAGIAEALADTVSPHGRGLGGAGEGASGCLGPYDAAGAPRANEGTPATPCMGGRTAQAFGTGGGGLGCIMGAGAVATVGGGAGGGAAGVSSFPEKSAARGLRGSGRRVAGTALGRDEGRASS